MNNLLNAIVMAVLILTFAFAPALGPATRSGAERTAMSPPAGQGLATAESRTPDKYATAD